ncbi:MAG: hypothetical protein ORN98_06590 [Alphaproteobacteria bacterium]|nr:hypothetical protein [Alphaproteobacteria bacterium]
MSAEKISEQIRIALAEGKGDKQAALRHLALMCARDDRLLRALVQPFLGGILMYALDREIKAIMDAQVVGKAESTPSATPQKALATAGAAKNIQTTIRQKPTTKNMTKEVMEELVNALSQSIPVGKPSVPIDGDPVRLIGIGPGDIPPPKAGPRHQRALQAVALSYKYKNA